MFDAFGADMFAALLLVVAVLSFRRIGGFFNLSKVRLRCADWAPIPRSELPAYIIPLLASAETSLKEIGFEFAATLAVEPLNILDPRARVYSEIYWHPGFAVLAGVELAAPSTGQVTKVQFMAAFTDGTLLVTMNREQFLQFPIPDGVILGDAYADDLAGQWRAHREAMVCETKRRIAITERGEVIRRHAGFGPTRWVARLAEMGWVVEEVAGQYRFTPRGAWRYSGQIANPPQVVRKVLARPYRHDPAPPVKAVRRAEMDSVAANIALAAHPYPAWMKAVLFALTLALSAILFGRGFGLLDAAALLAVLLIHELGHLGAMWAFGYRNLSIFFLPLLGAAATGHKPNAPPSQEALVLLAGPLFGLVLAFAATQIPSESLPPGALDFLRAFFWFGVVLNLFNLLPFGVLDGGRLFELAVLGRFPAARAAFATLGALLGLAYAAWNGSVVFGLAMLILLTSTRTQFRAAKVIAAVRNRARAAGVNALNGEQAIATLGREFAEGGYGGDGANGWMQRRNIAQLAYPRLLQGVPGIGVAVGAVLGLAAALTIPLVVLIWSWVQPQPAPLMRLTAQEKLQVEKTLAESPRNQDRQAANNEFVARYSALTDSEAKWAMLEDRRTDPDMSFDPAHVAWMDSQHAILVTQLPPEHPARIWQRLDQTPPGSPPAPHTLLAMLTQLTEGETLSPAELDDERYALFLHIQRRLAEEVPAELSEKRLAALDELWVALDSPDHPHAMRRQPLAVMRAHQAFSVGRIDEADSWMKRYLALNGSNGEIAGLTYAWFLIDAGRNEQALVLARNKLDQPEQGKSQWQAVAGWAELGLGRHREADTWFQAAQSESKARQKEMTDGLPWWMRILTLSSQSWGATQMRANAAALDHLAALQGYDPVEAERLNNELGKTSTAPDGIRRKMPFTNGEHEGWGKVRTARHKTLLIGLGFKQ